MTTLLRRLVLLFLAVGFMAIASVGCETTKGLGREVEDLGGKMQGQ